jgi:hypothetical protein
LAPTSPRHIFDAGARTAAPHEAQATYDGDAALYRNTVLTAFQAVEDSLSSVNDLRDQTQAFANICHRDQQLFASEKAQLTVGVASEQDLLTPQLALIQADQNLKDSQALVTQSRVTLIENLGGGWQWRNKRDEKQGDIQRARATRKDLSSNTGPDLPAPHRNIPNEHCSEWQASRKACFLKLRTSVQSIDATDDRSYGRRNRQTWWTAYKSLCVDESLSVSPSLRGSCHVQAETHPVNFRMRHVLVLIVMRDPPSPC